MCSMQVVVLFCVIFSSYASFHEITAGLYREGDAIVAKEKFYKRKVPFKIVYGYYYKKVKCPITFIKVTDRLGVTPGPKAELIKGGLGHNYVVILVGSAYNRPVFVDVYIGCQSMRPAQKESVEAYDDE